MSPHSVIDMLFLALLAMTALLVATIAGFLTWIDLGKATAAIRQAGVAFAGTFGLGAAIWAVVGGH